MKISDGNFKAHVFVCTNKRDDSRKCCAKSGGEQIRKELKEWLTSTHPEWKKLVRINNAGCLDKCEEGTAISIYPQNIWLTHAEPKDIDAIKEQIVKICTSAIS